MERATHSSDRIGADAILNTSDVERIYIQIKSSIAGAKRFEARKKHLLILPIVIRTNDTPEEIRKKTYEIVERQRGEFLKERRSRFDES